MIKTHTILIRLTGSAEIPQRSFVKISSYSPATQKVTVVQSDTDNIEYSGVLINPDLTTANKVGLGYVGGIHAVKKAIGETVVAGDKVGTKENDWFAKEFCRGMFYVIAVISDYLILRATTRDILVFDVIAIGAIDGTGLGSVFGLSTAGDLMCYRGIYPAYSATLWGVALDDEDNMYLCGDEATAWWDYELHPAVWKFDRYGNRLLVFATAEDNFAKAIAVDSNHNIMIATSEVAGSVIEKYNSEGVQIDKWLVTSGPPSGIVSGTTRAVKTDSSGNIYVGGAAIASGVLAATVWVLDSSCVGLRYFNTGNCGEYNAPGVYDIALDKDGNVIVVGSNGNEYEEVPPTITVWKLNNNLELQWSANTIDIAFAVAVDKDGDIYVGTSRYGDGASVWKFKSGGGLDTDWGINGKYDTGTTVSGLAVDDKKNLYIVGKAGLYDNIEKLNPNGTSDWKFSTGQTSMRIAVRGKPLYEVY